MNPVPNGTNIRVADRCLLDSQMIIWAMKRPERLTPHHRQIIAQREMIVVSVAVIWEIEIKREIGKLDAPDDLLYQLSRANIEILPISADHAVAAARLPMHHRDPFDRMLIAQAQIEGFSVLTSDKHFKLYDVALA